MVSASGGGVSRRRRLGHVCGAGARERVCEPAARRAERTWKWKPPPATPGGPPWCWTGTAPAGGNVSGYRIDMSNRGGVWETLVMDTASTATTYTDSALTAPDSALTASDTRWYRVFARNEQARRLDLFPTPRRVPPTRKGQPRLGAEPEGCAQSRKIRTCTRLDLSWDAPAADGGEMIVGYEIQAHNWKATGRAYRLRPSCLTPGECHRCTTKTSYTDRSTDAN